jgi:hypothetical protein
MYMPDGGGCRIRLSAPLLKFRPVKDLKMVVRALGLAVWLLLLQLLFLQQACKSARLRCHLADRYPSLCSLHAAFT